MSSDAWADKTIAPPTKGVRLVRARYSLRDIAKLCHRAFLEDRDMLRDFAKAFPPTRAGLRSIFDFVDRHFEYQEDRAFSADGDELAVQAVQSPAAMWHLTRNGDCKSFTVFIACAVHHMGLPVIFRLVGYGSKTDYHIYPVAVLNGKEVPLDVVFRKQQNGAFGTEKIPMKKVQDILEAPGLYKVGTTAQAVTAKDIESAASQIAATFSDISDSVIDEDGGDITTMTQGEFDVWLLRRSLAANDMKLSELPTGQQAKVRKHLSEKTAAAFKPMRVALPPVQEEVSGIKDAIDKIKDALQKALKKLANAFHKVEAGKLAPFFLFQYLPPAQLAKAALEVRRRKAQQDKVIDSMVKKGNVGSREAILASMATEFKKKHGCTPQEALAAAGGKKVGVVGVAAAATYVATHPKQVAAAGKALFGFIGKLIKLFKKKDKDDEAAEAAVADANASDLALLEGTDTGDGTTTTESKSGSDSSTTTEGGDNNMLLIGLGIGALALLMMGGKKGQ